MRLYCEFFGTPTLPWSVHVVPASSDVDVATPMSETWLPEVETE
jgi:hypothetical protein